MVVIGDASFEDLYGQPLDQQQLDFSHVTATLPYSSGTTGLPKGVMLTHRNLVANLAQSAAVNDFRPDDVALVAIPMFHIYGLNGLMNAFLAHGVPFVTLPRFRARGSAVADQPTCSEVGSRLTGEPSETPTRSLPSPRITTSINKRPDPERAPTVTAVVDMRRPSQAIPGIAM